MQMQIMSHGTNECYRVYDAAYDQNTANIRSSVPKTIHLSGLHPLSMKKFFNKRGPFVMGESSKRSGTGKNGAADKPGRMWHLS